MSLSLERIEVFLLAYAGLVVCTVIALSSLMVLQIDVYVAAFIVEYFVMVLATAPHYPVEIRRERIVGVMLFVVFAEILIRYVVELLK